MSGLADTREVAILNAEFTGTTYLALFTGTAGQAPNDSGSLPGGMVELSTNGWSRKTITSSMWNAAVGGAPTIKTLPRSADSPIRWTPTVTTTGICAWALLNHATNAVSSATLLYSGVFVDNTNTPIIHTVSANEPFDITNGSPLTLRLGDAPNGLNPT